MIVESAAMAAFSAVIAGLLGAGEFAAMAADPGNETAAVAAEVATEAADPGCAAAVVGGVGAAGGRGGDPARSSGGEVVLVRT